MKCSLLILVLLAVACKPSRNDSATPTLGDRKAGADGIPNTTTTTSTTPEALPLPEPNPLPEPTVRIEAKLTGVPQSPNTSAFHEINVSGAKEYKFKYGNELTACDSPTDYSSYTPVTTSIKLDLSTFMTTSAVVKLCVIGKDGDNEQKDFTQATWAFTPNIPTLADQVQLIDGNNQVTLQPTNLIGNWIIVRSLQALTATPTPGRLYNANDTLGGGTVIASGAIAQVVDMTPRNGQTFIYNFFAINEAKRYSIGLNKSITLSQAGAMFAARNNIGATMVPLARVNNDNRFACRSQMIENGVKRGIHPGTLVPGANNNFRAGTCFFEYGGNLISSTEYELLVLNKTTAANTLVYRAATVDANGKPVLPTRSVISGYEGNGNVMGENLFFCLGYTDVNKNVIVGFGKMGPHLNNFCYMRDSQGNYLANPNYDVLTLR